jgi:hypothetical protein
MFHRWWLSVCVGLALIAPAMAQNFVQPTGQNVLTSAQMCWNGLTNTDGTRQAVPCSSPAALPINVNVVALPPGPGSTVNNPSFTTITQGGNQAIVDFTGALKVGGTVTANQGTNPWNVAITSSIPLAVTQSGAWTVGQSAPFVVQQGQPGATPWPATISQGGNQALVDLTGALKVGGTLSVNPHGVFIAPSGAPTAANTETHSAAAEATRSIVGPHNIYNISGSIGSTTAYVMIYDATTLPGDGAVTPKKCYGPFNANTPFSMSWLPGPPLAVTNGFMVSASSTGCFTKTATNVAFLSVEYQ